MYYYFNKILPNLLCRFVLDTRSSISVGGRHFSHSVKIIWILLITGIAYIKYSKASEAFNAIEFMNGYRMGASNSPIKVLIASRYYFIYIIYWTLSSPIYSISQSLQKLKLWNIVHNGDKVLNVFIKKKKSLYM